jgi:transposase
MREVPRFAELTLTEAQRDAFLARVQARVSAEDYRVIEGLIHALPKMLTLIEQDPMALRKLQHLLFGSKTEQTDRVCPSASPPAPVAETPKPKGHGRIRAEDYTGARWVDVPHPELKPGCLCPLCAKGSVRAQPRPAIILRIVGSPPITATGYAMARLRCDACGEVFTAPKPVEAAQEKYASNVGVTIALLRYGTGLPHYRLERLQRSLGVPLPASTQWELMAPLSEQARPIFDALVVQAANAPLLQHDDTTMRILDLRRPGSATAGELALMDPKRKGTFTTNVLAEVESHPVALYFTGWQHAGENLAEVLQQRAHDLAPPIQMCDALSRNTSPPFDTILAHCLAHGRREFVSVAPSFPEECRYVLETLRDVYRFDAEAKAQRMNPAERLGHHQTHSQPLLTQLQTWMQHRLDDKLVEPNSGLGQAIGYMLKHWIPLTLFLREPGAPLDNNRCEQALKLAILHRKNSLSYKTVNGARTGDLFMSLIHTCRLNAVNPFAYLLAIATHPTDVGSRPSDWLPWNYPQTETPAVFEHDPPGHPA